MQKQRNEKQTETIETSLYCDNDYKGRCKMMGGWVWRMLGVLQASLMWVWVLYKHGYECVNVLG